MNSCLPTTSSTMNQPPRLARHALRLLLRGASPDCLRMAPTCSGVSSWKSGFKVSPGNIRFWACSGLR